MHIAALPPVRRRVELARWDPNRAKLLFKEFFGGRESILVQSGTAALSAAVRECSVLKGVEDPEAVVPAYCCPDLVAACEHAGVRVRLVDINPGTWGLDAASLARTVSANTVAIIAVNLLGVGDGLDSISPIARKSGIRIIQDSAQYLPVTKINWPADYVVISFGRGKPLNLLGGGALVLPLGTSRLSVEPPVRSDWRHRLGWYIRSTNLPAIAFNLLTVPVAYGALSRLPGLDLGTTKFEPLEAIWREPEEMWSMLGTNLERFRSRASYRRDRWNDVVESWRALGINALTAPSSEPVSESLRLALIAPDVIVRDALVEGLNSVGLGATPFYARPLHRIDGVPTYVAAQGPFPHAERLAETLFTLPTHTLVGPAHVKKADAVVRTVLASLN